MPSVVPHLIKIHDLPARRIFHLSLEPGEEIVAVKMNLVLLVVYGMPFFKFFFDVRLSNSCQQGRNHVLVGGDAVELCTRLDNAWPFDKRGYAESSFPGCSFLTVEGDCTAVWPGEGLSTVIGGIKDDGVVINAQFFQLGKDTPDTIIVLEHAIGINADTAFAFPLLGEVGPNCFLNASSFG